jgi:hypothetical protein
VTDDEAAAIEEEASREDTVDPEVRVREEVDEEVRECTKACWGNLGACYTSLVSSSIYRVDCFELFSGR